MLMHCLCSAHLVHHMLLLFSQLLTCILHFHLRWAHIFLYLGMIQWVGSILDLLRT